MKNDKMWWAHNSEIGQLIQSIDWSDTPLEGQENWSQSFKSALRMCLSSNSPAGIFWGDDLLFFYNDAWCDLLGDKHPSALGQPVHEVLDDFWSIFAPFSNDILSDGISKMIKNQALSFAGGEEQYFDFSLSPIPDDDGAVAGIFSIVTETTDVDRSKKQRENRQELEDLFENANISIHWVDGDGIIRRANKAELDLLGYSHEEYVGSHIADFHVDDDVIDEILAKLNNREELKDYEARLKCKDGSIKHVLINSNVYEKNGKFVHTRCFTKDITQRKQHECDLRKSEKKYRTLFESIDEGFCIIKVIFDEDGKPVNYRYLETNPAYEEHTGLEDVEGKTANDIIPDLEDWWYETYGEVAMTGESVRFEKLNDELQRWFDIYAFRIGEPGERKVAVLFKNITERKENELSDAYLSAIVENSDDAIISKDLEGTITSWNESAEQMFGYTAEEAIGKSITLIIPDNRLDEEEEILSKLRRGDKIDHFETKRQRKDGSMLDISLTISPVRNSDGEIVGASKIARDITERKEAERKLVKNRNRLRTALEIDTVGVIFWGGEDFTITEVNDAFLDMTGYTRDEILGKSWRDLTPEEYYSVSEQGVQDLKTTGEPDPYEKQFIRKDGSRWWGLCAPRRIDDNEVVEFLLDITDRKEAKEKLEEINETLEERVEKRTKKLRSYQRQLRSLASQLNKAEERERQRLASELHDKLGQMLAVAKMKAEGLQHGNLFEKPVNDVKELKQVIDDALKYNQNLMAELKPPPVLDKEDVSEVLHWTAKKIEKKGLDVIIENDGKPKPVEKEIRTMLHQSVRELLQNVNKHAGVNEARLAISRKKDHVKIVVEDNGKGFDVEGNMLTPTDKGRFGLFNIQERMDWHGGTFKIDSELGKGTKVVLYAPLKDQEEKDVPVMEEAPPVTRREEQIELWQKIKVLLVDDHEMVRRGLRQMIEKQEDLEIVAEASNGKEAIELARSSVPDIIVMDVNMPVLDGIEATQKIKSEMPNVRIIGLSLHDSQEVIDDMRSAGASDYLTKDEAFETLCTTIRQEAKKVHR